MRHGSPLALRVVCASLPICTMPVLSISVHPLCLHPIEAVKAWQKHCNDVMSLDDIIREVEVLNLHGDSPGRHALWSAIRRVRSMSALDLVPTGNYAKCGRIPLLSAQAIASLAVRILPSRANALYQTELILHAIGASLRLPTLACATFLSVPVHNSVSIFLSQTVPPRANQKVSKQNRRVCFELCYACRTSYSSMLLSDMRARLPWHAMFTHPRVMPYNVM